MAILKLVIIIQNCNNSETYCDYDNYIATL